MQRSRCHAFGTPGFFENLMMFIAEHEGCPYANTVVPAYIQYLARRNSFFRRIFWQ